MGNLKIKLSGRSRRKNRIRKKVMGTTVRPRLCVFRSNMNIYAQVIDDSDGRTIAAASTMDKDLKSAIASRGNIDAAKKVGEAVAKKAMEKGVESVVFDRGGYIYHGRIKALADSAREAGLKF
jgi:large subunit ribosomal protein L18